VEIRRSPSCWSTMGSLSQPRRGDRCLAHGVSRGIGRANGPAPAGAAEAHETGIRGLGHTSLTPLTGLAGLGAAIPRLTPWARHLPPVGGLAGLISTPFVSGAFSAAACRRGTLLPAFCEGDAPARPPSQPDSQAAKTPPSPPALRARRLSRSAEQSPCLCPVHKPRRGDRCLAHGVSRGIGRANGPAPAGAAEAHETGARGLGHTSLTPLTGLAGLGAAIPRLTPWARHLPPVDGLAGLISTPFG